MHSRIPIDSARSVSIYPYPPHPRRVKIIFGIVLVLALTLAAFAQSQPRVVESRSSPDPYHLFVGIDLLIPRDGELTPVTSFDRAGIRLAGDTEPFLPIEASGQVVYRRATKLGAEQIVIEDYRIQKAFSSADESAAEQVQVQSFIAEQAARAQRTQIALLQTGSDIPTAGEAGEVEVRNSAGSSQQDTSAKLQEVESSLERLSELQDITTENPELLDSNPTDLPDAAEVTFRISNESEIDEAYAFVVMRVLTDKGLVDTNFFQRIGRISPEPRTVSFSRKGLAPGFEIKETQIHIFAQGRELPTSLSEQHFELSMAEAREFALLSHLGDNRGQTLPARPAWELVSNQRLEELSRESLEHQFTVDISVNGDVVKIHDQPDDKLTGAVAILENMLFLPALDNGEPVQSTTSVRLANFHAPRD